MPEQTEREHLWQKVGELEGKVDTHHQQISEIFAIQRQHAEINTQTATLLQGLAEKVDSAHTPDTCPQKPRIERMWTLFVVLGALVGVLGALGLLGRIGSALWNAVFH